MSKKKFTLRAWRSFDPYCIWTLIEERNWYSAKQPIESAIAWNEWKVTVSIQQVYSFMSQVSEGVPKLTALGYFNISKKLIPQVYFLKSTILSINVYWNLTWNKGCWNDPNVFLHFISVPFFGATISQIRKKNSRNTSTSILYHS